MATITPAMVNAWTDNSKMVIATIDAELESQIVAQVFSKLQDSYDVTLWINEYSVPKLVQSVISMIYAGMSYNKIYAIDANVTDAYGNMLIRDANALLESIVNGVAALYDIRPTVTIVASTTGFNSPIYATEVFDSEPKFEMDQEW